MTLVPNRPSEAGRALGVGFARMADAAEVEILKQFPNAKPRCGTCAFRGGTVPNGCAATQMDALKCVMEIVPFFCHESPKDGNGGHEDLCAGWATILEPDAVPVKAPWEFSCLERDEKGNPA